MEKRYQVFVSSTFADLKEERQAVMQGLLSLEHFPAGMELFPASDEDQLTLIYGVIDDSDYYVLVIGGRYGSTNEEGISYTELEFDYALSKGKPVLVFVHEAPSEIPQGKTDASDKLRKRLDAFIKKVQSGRHVKYWKNPDDLKAKVIQGISAETRRSPQEGWVRGGRASDPLVTEQLRQEIDRLTTELSSARTAPPVDAGNFAGGDDKYAVGIEYRDANHVEQFGEISLGWDFIFRELGPVMFEEASEQQMRLRLSQEIWLYELEKYGNGSSHNISNESFDTIKIQLLALGLIKKSDRKHVPSDTNRYWSLTAYGETLLMKLRAIAKPKIISGM